MSAWSKEYIQGLAQSFDVACATLITVSLSLLCHRRDAKALAAKKSSKIPISLSSQTIFGQTSAHILILEEKVP